MAERQISLDELIVSNLVSTGSTAHVPQLTKFFNLVRFQVSLQVPVHALDVCALKIRAECFTQSYLCFCFCN